MVQAQSDKVVLLDARELCDDAHDGHLRHDVLGLVFFVVDAH